MKMTHSEIAETIELIRSDPANPAGFLALARLLERAGNVRCERTPGDWPTCRRYCCAEWAYRQAWLLAPDDSTAPGELKRICSWGSRDNERFALEEELRKDWIDPPLSTIGSLGATGEPDAVPLLLELTSAERPAAVSGSAYAALGRIGDPRGFQAVVAGLYDMRKKVQEKAIAALRRYGTARAAEAFIERLDSPVKLYFREKVLEALGDIGHLSAVSVLEDALSSDSHEIVAAAVIGLGSMRHPAAFSTLLDAVRRNDAWTRYFTAFALANYQEPEAVRALIKILDDPESGNRLAAASALDGIGDVAKPAREEIAAIARRESDEDIRSLLEGVVKKLES
ncbi:MAG: HEAT repeat domain-containing protein [Planctomycetota bacterium]|nr:MAG: HEAT repeat domain-containing protein [Planctomycetota bacterium]